jgi:hypothetical protein
MAFDPRKTQVLADFAEVLRGAGGSAGPGALRDSRAPSTDATPAVVVARTVIASGEPRSLALAKTQVWRSELTLEAKTESPDATRERAQVQVDESVMQHLSAEVWAGQLAQASRMMVTEVRRSVVDVQATFVETQKTQRSSVPAPERETRISERSESASVRAELVVASERSTRPTPIATEIYEPVRIPRSFQLPDARTLRIAGAVTCILGVAIVVTTVMSERRAAEASSRGALLKPAAASGAQGQPMEVKSTWPAEQPAPATRQPTPAVAPPDAMARREEAEDAPEIAGASKPEREPFAKPPSQAGARAAASPSAAPRPASGSTNPTITTASPASPRAAVDALIAGKPQLALSRYRALAKSNPNDPVYEAAARILEEAQQRSAE